MSIASISDRRKRPGPFSDGTAADPLALMQVVTALQTTLVLEELVTLFARQVERYVPRATVTYRHPYRLPDIVVGSDIGRHRCEYNLTLGDASLGEVRFRREQRFSARELERLENLLVLLLHPLRNALLYGDAVNAAASDPLTGLGNRKGLEEALDKEIVRAERYEHHFSLLFLDLDHFKQVNDAHGHLGGDTVLIKFAALLERLVRDCDSVFRFGGEEFAVLLPNTSLEGAEQLADRLRAETSTLQIQYNGQRINLTISIGVTAHQPGDTRAVLMERVDRALYRAKEAGRNCVASARPGRPERHEVG